MSDKGKNSGLSIVIITLNEEAWVGKCMNALAPLDAEIVVVDSGSKDKTLQIAESQGATVISHEWQGYAYARNLGAQKASNDWILAIDADEIMSPSLAEEIQNADRSISHNVFLINRLTYIGKKAVKHSGWHPDYVARLYHRLHARWEGNFVHEKLDFDKQYAHRLSTILDHYSYSDIEDHQNRMVRYSELSGKKLFHNNVSYNPIKVELKAIYGWFRTYILNLGILDGKIGLYLSKASAQSIRMKYAVLKRLIEEG